VPDARVIPIGGDRPGRSSTAADAVAAGAARASGERTRRRRTTPLLRDGEPTEAPAARPTQSPPV